MRIQGIGGFLVGVVLSAPLAFAGQSAGPGWMTAPPDHLTLFKLYMAANADVLDKDDQAAWEYYLLFKVPPSTPTSQQCAALNMQLQNEITAHNLLNAARAEFKSALAQTKDWSRTAVFRVAARASLNPYEAATGSFPVLPMGPLFMSPPNGLLKVPRDPGSQSDIGLHGPAKSWCNAIMRAGSISPPPHFALDITGNEAFRSVPMSATAAETYLNSHPNRDVQFEVIIEAGPAVISRSHADLHDARVVDCRRLGQLPWNPGDLEGGIDRDPLRMKMEVPRCPPRRC